MCELTRKKKILSSKQHYTNFRVPVGRGVGNVLGNEEQK